MAVSTQKHKEAKRLFITEGKTLSDIAKITGVSGRTLANWSANEGWVECRRAPQVRGRIENNLIKIYEGLTENAAKTLDPQDVRLVLEMNKIISKKKGV